MHRYIHKFLLLKSGPRLIYFPGHIGVYLGKKVQCGEKEDEVCNVVECTSSWNGGIQLSYVNSWGKRYNKKNVTEDIMSDYKKDMLDFFM